MFVKTQSESARLAVWRKFRQDFPHNGSAQLVVEAFAPIKPLTRYIDYYLPENWFSAFEIVKEGLLCPSGITLVMASTLVYLKLVNSENLRFDVISNHITGTTGLVLVHDGFYYNFIPGEIVTAEYAEANSICFAKHIIASDKLCH